jgi:hypothetical protein
LRRFSRFSDVIKRIPVLDGCRDFGLQKACLRIRVCARSRAAVMNYEFGHRCY